MGKVSYSNKNSEVTNGCRKWRNTFKKKNLLSWQNICNSRQITADTKRKYRKSRRGPSWRRSQLYLFTFPYQTNGKRATELSTVGHVISEPHWKSIFNFTEIINNYGLKRGTACHIVRFIFHFSPKLYIQYWKYFYSMILRSVGRNYSKKNRVLEFLGKIFGQVASVPLMSFVLSF